MTPAIPGRPGRFLALSALAAAVALSAGPAAAHDGTHERIAELTRRIEADPSDARLFLERGELHRVHRDADAALADYRRSQELDASLALVDFCMGRLWLETGRPAMALEPLDRFLASQPDHPDALLFRGRARSGTGDPGAAATDYAAAIAAWERKGRRPPPEAYIEGAKALASTGPAGVDAALGLLGEGLARLGAPVTLELAALEIEESSGRAGRAVERLDRLAAVAARPEAWLVRKAKILERSGRPDQARHALEEALEAIESLSAARRNTPAALRLEDEARTSLARIARTDATDGHRPSDEGSRGGN